MGSTRQGRGLAMSSLINDLERDSPADRAYERERNSKKRRAPAAHGQSTSVIKKRAPRGPATVKAADLTPKGRTGDTIGGTKAKASGLSAARHSATSNLGVTSSSPAARSGAPSGSRARPSHSLAEEDEDEDPPTSSDSSIGEDNYLPAAQEDNGSSDEGEVPSSEVEHPSSKPRSKQKAGKSTRVGTNVENDGFEELSLCIEERPLAKRLVPAKPAPQKKRVLSPSKSRAVKHLKPLQSNALKSIFALSLFHRITVTPKNVTHNIQQLDLDTYGRAGLFPDQPVIQYLMSVAMEDLDLELTEQDAGAVLRCLVPQHATFASTIWKHLRCAIVEALELGTPIAKHQVRWAEDAKEKAQQLQTDDFMLSRFWGNQSKKNPKTLTRASLFQHPLLPDLAGRVLSFAKHATGDSNFVDQEDEELRRALAYGAIVFALFAIENTLCCALKPSADSKKSFSINFGAATFDYDARFVAAHNRLEALSNAADDTARDSALIEAVMRSARLFGNEMKPKRGLGARVHDNQVKEEFE